mmetsp:Transcript_139432/g.445991  ORF Transcript_139432/g.445991 Transcript_139432/m.445991 type:complete len:228 (-) Transcript_139432:1966-2649(-)
MGPRRFELPGTSVWLLGTVLAGAAAGQHRICQASRHLVRAAAQARTVPLEGVATETRALAGEGLGLMPGVPSLRPALRRRSPRAECRLHGHGPPRRGRRIRRGGPAPGADAGAESARHQRHRRCAAAASGGGARTLGRRPAREGAAAPEGGRSVLQAGQLAAGQVFVRAGHRDFVGQWEVVGGLCGCGGQEHRQLLVCRRGRAADECRAVPLARGAALPRQGLAVRR